ncbi:unnamed protein product [Prunus armeniaca]
MIRPEAQCQITILEFGTNIREPAVVFASKNTAPVSQPIASDSSSSPPHSLTYAEKDKLKCDHYGEKRHTIDICWALHGVLNYEKEHRCLKKEQLGGKAHMVATATHVADVTTG